MAEKSNTYDYFLRELSYLKKEGAEFAKRYPDEAKFLNMDELEVKDPHVERLIESFAFIGARIQRNIDLEYPHLISFIANCLYPNLSSPVPSCAITHMDANIVDCAKKKGVHVPAGSVIETIADPQKSYEFRTVYDTTMWPLVVSDIDVRPANTVVGFEEFGTLPMMTININSPQISINTLEIEKLRFYINLEDLEASNFYQAMFCNVRHVLTSIDNTINSRKGPEAIHPVGFHRDERLINVPEQHRSRLDILFDYIYFKRKFMFFEVDFHKDFTDEMNFHIVFDQVVDFPDIDQNSLLMNCSPVVNISSHFSTPFPISDVERAYKLLPSHKNNDKLEVHSVENIYFHKAKQATREILSLFDFESNMTDESVFWSYERTEAFLKDMNKSELFVSFVNKDHQYFHQAGYTAYGKINCLCFDYYDLLEQSKKLKFKDVFPVKSVSLISALSKRVSPIFDTKLMWLLYSCLRFDQISICDVNSGKAITDILRALNRFKNNVAEHNIGALKNIELKEAVEPMKFGFYPTFIRGYKVFLDVNPENYSGGVPYLFGAVIEKFFSTINAVNSFTQTHLRYIDSDVEVKRWPIRTGRTKLI